MKINRTTIFIAVSVLWITLPQAALACPSCFGESDSPLAYGMNAGIFTLLGVVGVVLSGVAAFGIFIANRAGAFDWLKKPKPKHATTEEMATGEPETS